MPSRSRIVGSSGIAIGLRARATSHSRAIWQGPTRTAVAVVGNLRDFAGENRHQRHGRRNDQHGSRSVVTSAARLHTPILDARRSCSR